jgi:cytochrome c-type biogenesis protein CcmF
VVATLTVFQNGQKIDVVTPEKDFYPRQEQPTTEMAVRSTLLDDLYVILAGWESDGTATFKVIVNPLITWLWVGFLVLVAGSVVAMAPDPQEARVMERLRAREIIAVG